ncbi:hypothetical protein C2G38_2111502 [Gigaspora rosea]|uniref:Uncharacterized protein n=1 Tax=Gigaspora rosea TaxID=44941 RepID=A0A397UDQ4_9GLOM|nr:hypothetical protein C2G38_2111502 [Gigaspora rosea]
MFYYNKDLGKRFSIICKILNFLFYFLYQSHNAVTFEIFYLSQFYCNKNYCR